MQKPRATRAPRTVGQLAEQSGVSARTLRYYEDLGILSPQRGPNGYRLYGPRDERRLAQILSHLGHLHQHVIIFILRILLL